MQMVADFNAMFALLPISRSTISQLHNVHSPNILLGTHTNTVFDPLSPSGLP